jgi:hypothetical protein
LLKSLNINCHPDRDGSKPALLTLLDAAAAVLVQSLLVWGTSPTWTPSLQQLLISGSQQSTIGLSRSWQIFHRNLNTTWKAFQQPNIKPSESSRWHADLATRVRFNLKFKHLKWLIQIYTLASSTTPSLLLLTKLMDWAAVQ